MNVRLRDAIPPVTVIAPSSTPFTYRSQRVIVEPASDTVALKVAGALTLTVTLGIKPTVGKVTVGVGVVVGSDTTTVADAVAIFPAWS